VVGQPGQKSPLRRAEAHRDQQISRPENLPGFGNNRTMKRGNKDEAQVAAKLKLEMPK